MDQLRLGEIRELGHQPVSALPDEGGARGDLERLEEGEEKRLGKALSFEVEHPPKVPLLFEGAPGPHLSVHEEQFVRCCDGCAQQLLAFAVGEL